MAADLVQRGNAARQAGHLQDAIDAWTLAAGLEPKRYEIRILIADTLRRMGRGPDAAAAYAAAQAVDPTRSEAYSGQALLKRGAYDYNGAAAVVEEPLETAQGPARADLLVSLGETRRHQGRTAEAEDLFRQALAADAGAAAAHDGLARIMEARGDLDAAIAHWDLYLKARPGDGAAELRRKELREARAAIAAVRDAAAGAAGKGPSGAAVWAELGRLQAMVGNQPEAIVADRTSLRRRPDDAAARRALALALAASGDRKGAAAEFDRLLKVAPADGTALYQRVALARDSGDAAGEEAAWIDLVRRRPDDLYAARVAVSEAEGAGAEALQRLVAAAPPAKTAGPARLRALAHAALGAWDAAGRALDEALRFDPTDPWTIEVLTDILSRRPEMLAKIAALADPRGAAGGAASSGAVGGASSGGGSAGSASGAIAAADPVPVLMLARYHLLAGRPAQAAGLIRRAAEIAPGSSIVHSALAEMAASPRDPEPGLAELRRAVEADPKRLAAHVDLALALLRAGRSADAAAAAKSGLAAHPGAAPLLSLLGAARADAGDLEGAARAYDEALVADPADNFHLARGQYPLVLAALGRQLEARRTLEGLLPEFPEMEYDEAWTFARDTFRDRHYSGQDWSEWRDRFHGRMKTPLEAHAAIAVMLGTLQDPWTRLRDPEETSAVYLTRHGEGASVDPLGRNRPHARTVTAEDLPGNLGYVRIANFTDPNAVAEVRRALQKMSEKEGLVLDLRGNTGGLARSADEVADLLVGPGTETGSDVGPDGSAPRVTKGEGAVTKAPITVLVDAQTASAAERLAGSLESAGRATLVGESTFGKGEFQNSRVLTGGWTVLVSAGEALGPNGQPIQGHGLKPRPRSGPADEKVPGAKGPDTSPAATPEPPDSSRPH